MKIDGYGQIYLRFNQPYATTVSTCNRKINIKIRELIFVTNPGCADCYIPQHNLWISILVKMYTPLDKLCNKHIPISHVENTCIAASFHWERIFWPILVVKPLHFYWSTYANLRKWVIMYLFVSRINIASFDEFSIGFRNYSDSVTFLIFPFIFRTPCTPQWSK